MTKKHPSPKISIILPVYNAERFLRESIDSLLRQTFENFELIIINDGSTDGSEGIIHEYEKRDPRIITLTQENQGVVKTANKAISMAQGEYIARMDADDVSMPNRLLEESRILDNHPHTVLVCSSFEVIDEEGEFRFKDIVPPGTDHLKRSLYLRNPIANGSTLIRKDALIKVGLFDEVFAEDLHMWTKLMSIGDFESTGTVLYRWRMNLQGLTLTNNDLSMSKGKEYIAQLWQAKRPSNITRSEIKKTVKSYERFEKRRAKEYIKVYLTDVSQLAAKLFLNGHYLSGLRQLFALAFSSKKGFKTATQRIYLVIGGRYSKLRRSAAFTQGSYDGS